MRDLYWLTEEEMAKLAPFFPKSPGKPRVDDRRVLSEIDLPRDFSFTVDWSPAQLEAGQ